MIGSTLSHYKIVEKLGEGGMGVVYKAEDTSLERAVALKFLADHLLDNEEAKQRFLREAKAAAALHHPNVCPVHEIAEADGKTFIAMAFLEGESLEDRIAKGPLSIRDALELARQVAEGLQAAHAKGVVHRDVKPANILVSPEGRPTIMDFGLARLAEASRLTKADTAMGTVAYMSPEQAQGLEVDGRTDIWALGCVLYEMVSGRRPFQGQYDQVLLYEIVHEEPPPLTSLRADVPMELEFIVGKCLAKEREDRYSAGDELAKDLRTLGEKLKAGGSIILRTPAMTVAQPLNPAATLAPDAVVVGKRRLQAIYALAVVLGLALAGLVAVLFFQTGTDTEPQPLRRFSFTPPPGIETSARFAGIEISPNGRHIAFTTQDALWVQDLDRDEPRRLEGTDGATRPFWAPDSEFIAYGARGELKKVSVHGGPSGVVCPVPGAIFFGGTWSPDGESIVFGSLSGGAENLHEVSSQGGAATPLIFPVEEVQADRPRFLRRAEGKTILVTAGTSGSSEMYAWNLDTGRIESLGPGDRPAYSAKTGHLIYQSERNVYDLWARPFSVDTLQFTGPAFPVRENVREPSVSQDGTLVFLDGLGIEPKATLAWRDREGKLLESIGQPQSDLSMPSLSPDGRRVAVHAAEDGRAIWIHNLARSSKERVTFEGGVHANPTWSPSGLEIAYRSSRGAHSAIKRKASDGTGQPMALVEAQEAQLFAPNWSRNGRYVLYYEINDETRRDIRYVELGANGEVSEPITFLATPSSERGPRLSPDGRFVAYWSDESGRDEIYVRTFPAAAERQLVSVNGGTFARWRRDGSELFYLEGRTLMAVSVSTDQGIVLGSPQPLFETSNQWYDVSANAQKFLTVEPLAVDGQEEQPMIRLVQNWYEEFRDREP